MILLDTGPLIASLSTQDQHHTWAYAQFKEHPLPFLSCESVVSEALFFLQKQSKGLEELQNLLLSGVIEIALDFRAEALSILELARKYQNVPMDLADACLVRMAEIYPGSQILTIDSDFTIYRRHRNKALNVIMPY